MRLSSVAWATALVLSSTLTARAEVPNFGYPPSGRVPILFNDRHVYAKPDELRRGRVLAALVRGTTILVPLRSLFEQLGGTVAYDRRTRSTVVRAPGTTVIVSVGARVVRINGEERPLDVPPEMHGGQVLVPVRVLVEALGAYVEYEPHIRAVVIRYVPPAAPTPIPLVPPPSVPSAPSAPVPRQTVPPGPPIPIGTPPPETFVAGDLGIAPRVSNAFAPNVTGATGQSFALRGATEFTLFAPFEIDGGYSRDAYAHPAGPVGIIGPQGSGSTFVPGFVAHDDETDVHLGAQLAPHKYYVAAGYLSLGNDYGYPKTNGFGAGFLKLPVLSDRISYDASAFYYPNVSGSCGSACPAGPYTVSYRVITFSGGLTYALGPVFLDLGYRGDRGTNKAFAPIGFSHDTPFAGLGLHF
jgi:hypothetical protein